MKKINALLLMVIFFAGIASAFAQKAVYIGKIKDVAETYKKKALAASNNLSASQAQVSHLLSNHERLVLTIHSSRQDGSSTLFFGEVYNTAYTNFYLKITGSQVTGSVVMRKQKKFYRYSSTRDGSVYLTPENIDKVLCTGIPSKEKANAVAGQHTASVSAAPPSLESLHGATAVLYLDFDGQTVTNTIWNNNYNSGNPIVADPADLSETEMTEVWKLVSEDYRPFQINVTTKESVFNDAPADHRMRVIFTPTTYFFPGAGGVAYVGSFTWGGTSFGETPCWVFNTTSKYAGEAASHEAGHTTGLSHDGRTSPQEEYFYGQESWAPIMGVGYYVPVVQWSKGEYPNANNKEDDLSIITTQNGFGFRTDDYGNSISSATPLVTNGSGNVSASSNKGVISGQSDVDVFSFSSTGGTASLTVNPDPDFPDLDVYLTLRNASNAVIATSDPSTQSASLNVSIGSGTYYLTVDGTTGSLGANSDYGSLGAYSISGTIPANAAPTVSITSPADGAIFSAPAAISIAATASDDGSIAKVEFFSGETKLGTDVTSPYTYSWTGVAAGTYSITAKATDNLGATTTSASVSISVSGNKSPTVSITSPANNTVYAAPATVTIKAAASASGGTIANVKFYNGQTYLKTVYSSPYTYTLSGLGLGTYFLTAKATDNNGLQTISAPDTILVLPAASNKVPVVSITSPANNTAYTAPATITLNASATDPDGTISVVKFYKGGTLAGVDSASPYTLTINNVSAGNYSFTAKAIDNTGLFSSSASVAAAVSVTANKAPAVSISTPSDNVVYASPATIKIRAAATDADGSVTVVKFYNGGTLLGVDSTSPFTFTISNPAAGNYSLVAKATDNKGLASSSASVAVQVAAVANKAPTVSITNPLDNVIYTAPALITMDAVAADEDGSIYSVKFYNGTTYLKTVFTSPYTYTLPNLPAGTYTLTAKATDDLGAQTTSAAVTVNVVSTTIVGNKPYAENVKTTLNNALSMKLAPNPAHDVVNISANGLPPNKPAAISIISVSGIVLKTINIRGSMQTIPVDVSSLPSGVYIIKILSGDKILYKQFVKL